ERVEERVCVPRVAHEEVTGHPHAGERHVEAPADLEHQHAQRDRDALAPRQHVVEERVPRVLVVVGVATEGVLDEEVPAQAVGVARGAAVREVVEAREPVGDVDRPYARRQEERGLVEADLLLRHLDEAREAPDRVVAHGANARAGYGSGAALAVAPWPAPGASCGSRGPSAPSRRARLTARNAAPPSASAASPTTTASSESHRADSRSSGVATSPLRTSSRTRRSIARFSSRLNAASSGAAAAA